MNNSQTNIKSDPEFDARLRDAHAAALANISPLALQRLRAARAAATQARATRRRWLWSGALPALLGVAIGVPYLHQHNARDVPAPAQAAHGTQAKAGSDDYTGTLDENPELYLWMASDGKQLAME